MERLVLWHRTLPPPFEEAETAAAYADWAGRVASGVQGIGGQVLSSLAGTVVGAFDKHELEAVVHLALRLLSEAERQNVPTGGLPIAFGVATGEVHDSFDAHGRKASVGSAIDRAQLLANQAGAGEVVLDLESREAAARTFLFGRTVSTSSFALRGEAVDRKLPLRRDCRKDVRNLQYPGVPDSMKHALAPIEAAAVQHHTQVFRLYGPEACESRDAFLQLSARLHPPLWLELGPVPGGLEPLGSLRLALLHQWSSPRGLRRAVEQLDLQAAEALEAIARADPPPRETVARALRVLLRIHTTQQGIPWLYLERISAIDRSTLSLLEEVLQDDRVAALVLLRATESDASFQCFQSLESQEVQLPPLSPAEATRVAHGILGESGDPEIARQVAIAGGDTARGVTEAARTLVAAGDLVQTGSRFVWRLEPKATTPIDTRTLVEERLGALEEDALRALETVCSSLPASCREVIEAAMEADGLTVDRRSTAIQTLQQERFITTELRPDSEVLRRVVIRRMPSARRAEVYRFVGDALLSAEPHSGPALTGTVGAYLCEGGDTDRGVRALLQAGVTAATRGYTRAAVRLAAVAVQFQPDKGTRSEASKISRSVITGRSVHTQAEADPEVGIRPTEPPVEPEQGLLETLRAGQHRSFDGLIEAAIADGANLASANCLRTISYACRGDWAEASRSLEDARRYADGDPATAVRLSLTASWLLLARTRADDAALHSMDALAMSRERGDALGTAAALKMLALCFRAAGNETGATQLEANAPSTG